MTLDRRHAGLLWPALALLGCGGDAHGPDAVPAIGTYAYQATLYIRASPIPIDYSGTLTLTYASADSVAGVWDVPGYQAAGRFGRRIDDAWELDARPTDARAAKNLDVVEHLINSDGTCASVAYAWHQDELILRRAGSCTLTKE